MPMFVIGAAAADINNDDDERPVTDADQKLGSIVPEKNVNESIGHNLLTHRASTSSNEPGNKIEIVNNTHPPLKRMLQAKPKLIPKFSIGQISIKTTLSAVSTNDDGDTVHQGRWIDDKAACDHFTSLLSSVYGLLLTIFSLALEISETFNAQEHLAEMIFYAFMYGGAVFFFAFCYLFILYPGWFDLLQKIVKKYGWITSDKVWQIDKASHSGEGAGSLYLRLGTVCFGTVGIVYYGLEIFLCTTNNSCHSTEYEKYALGGIFTFLQMHFIFCNSKVRINGSKNLAKFGTMHLVAVNLWTWFKYVLAKQAAKNSKMAKESYKTVTAGDSSSSSEEMDSEYDYALNVTMAALKKATDAAISTTTDPCRSANDFFGDTATLMTTCVVEFSLIGAGVMFVMWKTIGTGDTTLPGGRHGRKHRMRVDCSASSTGLFAGLLFLVAAFVSIGVFSALSQLAQSKLLQLVFALSDLALFLISLVGCALGLWRMRKLSYSHRGHGNAEVLDEILLIIGLIGEVTFCSAGLISWVGTQYVIQRQPVYIIFIYIARISQVLLQTVFILLSARLRALGATTQQLKPGKQFVTFLLVANVTLFLFHTFQGQRSGVGYSDGSAFFGAQSWSFLIQVASLR
uniref:Uncharacterized protein n=1 Tax=Plectus sambesii TaxID=2011161 RepID=A0A914WVR8_9BILA